jgi:hypothetical protein
VEQSSSTPMVRQLSSIDRASAFARQGLHFGEDPLSRQARKRASLRRRGSLREQRGSRGCRVVHDDNVARRDCHESCARAGFPSGSDEAFAEHDCLRLSPFARRHFPFLDHLAQDQKDEFRRGLVVRKMASRSHCAPQPGVQGFERRASYR